MAYLRHGSWRQAEKRKEEAKEEGRQPVKITRCGPGDSSGAYVPDQCVILPTAPWGQIAYSPDLKLPAAEDEAVRS